MSKGQKFNGLTRPPGLVSISLRGVSYITKPIPGFTISANGRPSAINSIAKPKTY